MFSAETYTARRKKIAEKISSGIILIFGNQLCPRNYKGNPYPFRQDSNFLYFTGIEAPGGCLMIDCESGKETLYGHDPGIEDTIWSGPQKSLKEWAALAGIEDVAAEGELTGEITVKTQRSITVHYLPPYPSDRIILLSSALGLTHDEIQRNFSVPLIKAIVAQREIKSAEEVAQIEIALNQVTGPMHMAAMKMAKEGLFEYQVLAEMQKRAVEFNMEFAYNTICSVRGETLHNISYNNKLKTGQLLLVDAGVESLAHYSSDITRTTPVGGKFNTQQKEIYEIVLQAQMQVISSLKPGITYREMHLKAATEIAHGLKTLGIMKGDVENAVGEGAHALFMPHGLGHMIGLDVHDMEDLGEDYVGYDEITKRSSQFGTAYLRLAKTLKPGFVLTVEPGIYFIPALINQWKSQGMHSNYINYEKLQEYQSFGGIRIEDNILITPEGHKILGNPIPKTVEEIESLT